MKFRLFSITNERDNTDTGDAFKCASTRGPMPTTSNAAIAHCPLIHTTYLEDGITTDAVSFQCFFFAFAHKTFQ